MSAAFRINTWDDIPIAITRLEQAGAGHRVPLLRALYQGEIAFLDLRRTGSSTTFKRWAAMVRLPAVCLLGDDDHEVPDGPATWSIMRRAMLWGRFVAIHGAAGNASHYEMLVEVAKSCGRLVLVECRSATIPDWVAAAERWSRGAEGIVLHPQPGAVHPAHVATGPVQ